MVLFADPMCSYGISFMGTYWSEPTLISFAYAFEQRTMVRNKVQPYVFDGSLLLLRQNCLLTAFRYLVPNVELAEIVGH